MDVEAILKEIRNRVVADDTATDASAAIAASANGSAPHANQSESLTRASAHLAVTSRSWDRLPPISSNRQGALARLEVWIKTKSRPLTRWFTWEQVNFNRAVNDALRDIIELLKAEAHDLAVMRAQLTQEMRREFSTLRSDAEGQGRVLQGMEIRANETDAALARLKQSIEDVAIADQRGRTKLTEQHARLQHELTNQQREHANLQTQHSMLGTEHTSLAAEHAKLASAVIELAGELRAEDRENKSQQDREIDQRLAALAAELKEEQRVCFHQVSLETSESAVLEDRARRALLQRLDKLEAALKTLQRQ